MEKDLRFKDYFLFTQHSLNTFDKCPLKFKKRYLDGLQWENFPDENVKKNIKRGLDFHLLANRYFSNTHTGLFEDVAEYDEMNNWYLNLKEHFEFKKDVLYLPEFKIRIAENGIKLEANYDLIVVSGDGIYIYDWKTKNSGTDFKIDKVKKRLRESLQTVVYLFVLSEQINQVIRIYEEKFGMSLGVIDRYNISMQYWMPESPFELECINYNNDLHQEFEQLIKQKINYVMNYDFEHFNKEKSDKHCNYCEFNWFCNNQKVDFGLMDEEDEDFMNEIEWEGIDELY